VEEINRAIVQMEQVTQQNAALVEQVTAATLSFEEESKRLAEAVARFSIARGERGNAVTARGIEAPKAITRRVAQITAARTPAQGEGRSAGRRGTEGKTQ
jgi:methyl-accepting chemotaxis protein